MTRWTAASASPSAADVASAWISWRSATKWCVSRSRTSFSSRSVLVVASRRDWQRSTALNQSVESSVAISALHLLLLRVETSLAALDARDEVGHGHAQRSHDLRAPGLVALGLLRRRQDLGEL